MHQTCTGHEDDTIVYDVDENTKSACWSPKQKRRRYMHRVGAITTYAINTRRTVLFLNIHDTQHTQEIPDINTVLFMKNTRRMVFVRAHPVHNTHMNIS